MRRHAHVDHISDMDGFPAAASMEVGQNSHLRVLVAPRFHHSGSEPPVTPVGRRKRNASRLVNQMRGLPEAWI